jgi:hypothetical protein
MQTLYRILDGCQSNGADVFLPQMWSDVAWNALPGVRPLHSAPKSVEDFAEGIAELVTHLVRRKNYACIRWV